MGQNDEHKTGIENGVKRRISFHYVTATLEQEPHLVEALCEGFVRANEIEIIADPEEYPCCIACGRVRYSAPIPCMRNGRAEPNCQEVFGITALLRRGYGTCIELACAQCAIKRVKDGKECHVIVRHQIGANGLPIPNQYHALLEYADGTIEDTTEEVKAANGGCMGGCPTSR